MLIKDLIKSLDAHVPFSTSESWDNVGLLIGSNESKVNGILTALDCTKAVVEEAIEKGINTIISHHPLIFNGTKRITDDGYSEVIKLIIKYDINLIALHTNLDVHPKGVNYMMAKKIGLTNIEILMPQKDHYYKILLFVPDENVDKIKEAFAEKHLAESELYKKVFYQTQAKGQFEPKGNANPTIGSINQTQTVYETKLELIVEEHEIELAKEIIFNTHPYEEPVYDLIKIERESERGLGIIGELEQPLNIKEFVDKYKRSLDIPAVRYIGDNETTIRTVAIVGGAGIEYYQTAKHKQADLFITGDVKHHEALDALMDGCNILDVNHYSEYVMKEGLKELLKEWLEKEVNIQASEINTDPYQYM